MSVPERYSGRVGQIAKGARKALSRGIVRPKGFNSWKIRNARAYSSYGLTLYHCPKVGRALRARRSVRRAEDCPPYPMVQFQGENGISGPRSIISKYSLATRASRMFQPAFGLDFSRPDSKSAELAGLIRLKAAMFGNEFTEQKTTRFVSGWRYVNVKFGQTFRRRIR